MTKPSKVCQDISNSFNCLLKIRFSDILIKVRILNSILEHNRLTYTFILVITAIKLQWHWKEFLFFGT